MQNLNALTPPAYLSQSLFPIDQPPEFDLRSWLDSLPPPCQSSLDLSSLNVPQKSAVTHGAGPVLLIAGAGTGKTRTLVHRVAWLIEQGVPPEAILLLTFTRKAAQEMLDRAAQLTPQALRVFGGTFHSTASLLLRRHGHHLSISSDFTILDQSDSEGIIGLITSSLRLSGSGRRFPNSKTVFGFISAAVNKNCSIDEAVQQAQPHLIEFSEDFYRILDHYTEFKSKHNLLDYDDLLLHLFRLLTELPEARLEVSSRFRHLLVDEYQDTNWLQSMLVKLLSSVHGNVMAVGDDAQSIYSFRGADHRNIMRFPEQHPGCAVIKLEQNYRSTAPILRFTNAALANAREKFDKQLFTVQPGGELPVLHAAASETAEARFVAEKIKELTVSGTALSEIAVLFRASHHAYRLELELAAAGLPFEKWGGIRLTESAHIKDVMACLRVLVNPQGRTGSHGIACCFRLIMSARKLPNAFSTPCWPMKIPSPRCISTLNLSEVRHTRRDSAACPKPLIPCGCPATLLPLFLSWPCGTTSPFWSAFTMRTTRPASATLTASTRLPPALPISAPSWTSFP